METRKTNFLQEILNKRGITKRWLSDTTGIDYHVIYRISYSLHKRIIAKQYIEKIAKALNIDIKDIVGDMYEDKVNNKQQGEDF